MDGQKSFSADAVSSLDRLSYMGKRGTGAFEFKPSARTNGDSERPLEMQSLVEAARRAVHGSLKDEQVAFDTLTEIIRVGTSAGGARAKAVIALHPETEEIRSGQFDLPEGFEHWLLKFDGMGEDTGLGSGQEYGKIEYAYYLMAKEAGIDMSPCRLLRENGRAHFMTRRFDRAGNAKHHIQTLCAMAHLDFNLRETHAYEQLFRTIHSLALGGDALTEAFRRMAFNVIARNCDDHTKNFAFILRAKDARWALAPAYDVTYAHNPESIWTRQHLMSIGGKFRDFTEQDLLDLAGQFMVPQPRATLARVYAAVGKWSEFAREAELSPVRASKIVASFERLNSRSI